MQTPSPGAGSTHQGSGPDFESQLDGLRLQLLALQQNDVGVDPELVSSLETAYEELRVADEEVRSQQEQIAKLVEDHHLLHWQHERMLTLLPIPALITDAAGIIRSANAAAAAVASMGVARMLGKPIFILFDSGDRRELRSFLSGTGPRSLRCLATVVPRGGEPVTVEVSAVVREAQAEVSWMLLAAERGHDRQIAVLPDALSRLAALPSRDLSLQEVLAEAGQVCRDTLDADVELSLTLGSPGSPDAVSATSYLAQQIDGAQVVAGSGPCLDAFEQRLVVDTIEIGTDPRWPRLAPYLPAESMGAVAAPIEVGERLVGALNVYLPSDDAADRIPALRDAVELLGATLGAVVYELELSAEVVRLGEHLERALGSRTVIEQAKGIIMGQRRCSPDEAFEHLVRLSSTRELKLRDVAAEIVAQVQR